MTYLWIDTRWEGRHGIGRYAREVCSRLTLPWRPLDVKGPPASPVSTLATIPPGLVYSPGYNVFWHAERQIVTVHDLIHLATSWPGRAKYLAYYNAFVRPAIRRAGIVITVSETSRRAISAWLNDPSVEVVNAGLGASPAFNLEVEPAPSAVPYIMYVGNLRAHKNIRIVLDALARVPRAHLRMLIPHQEHNEARRLFVTRGIQDRVTLLPSVSDDDLAALYRGATATVMPSTLEGFGLPALESIMTGTPVLFWRGCASVAETVGDRGLAVDAAHDVEEWAHTIELAMSAGRCTPPLAHVYSWHATASRVEKVLRERSIE